MTHTNTTFYLSNFLYCLASKINLSHYHCGRDYHKRLCLPNKKRDQKKKEEEAAEIKSNDRSKISKKSHNFAKGQHYLPFLLNILLHLI